MRAALLWFRRNLRLADNDAFIAAVRSGRPIIPVYVTDSRDSGRASRSWLHHSLASLDRGLRNMGGLLVLRAGEPEQVLPQLAADTGAAALYFCRHHEPASRVQEYQLRSRLPANVTVHEFDDGLLHDPDSVLTSGHTAYRVFTPFWKAAGKAVEIAPPRPVPQGAQFAGHALGLPEPELVPADSDSTCGLSPCWVPGERGALQRVDELESILRRYADNRDRPDLDATSRLSPHLHFGELSPRQVWHAVQRLEPQLGATSGCEALIRQLWWREFSTYLLHHFPRLPLEPLRSEFEEFPWLHDDSALEAWKRGRTGYPLVDAGMRQLSATGWMHNRVRMVAASFLVKHLLIPWQKGAAWFLDNLVDADLASNSVNWQWVSGCGPDAAPYFRIFNPALQARKFDPQDRYISQWVPEARSGEYPRPIVDHRFARHRALEAYRSIRGRRTSKQAP